MDKRCVNVSYPLRGGLMVVSFCTERAALAFVREESLASYKITIGSATFARKGM